MRTFVLVAAAGLAAVLGAGSAAADIGLELQDEMTPQQRVFVLGITVDAPGAAGEYVESRSAHNGAPVYQRADGTSWRLFRGDDRRWYVADGVTADPAKAVAATESVQPLPWSTSRWTDGAVAFRTARVTVAGLFAPSDFVLTGQLHGEMPVYQHPTASIWLYRTEAQKWVLDLSPPGSVKASLLAAGPRSEWPWEGPWSGGAVVFREKTLLATGVPGAAGNYVFTGDLHQGKPIYQHEYTGLWLYRHKTGEWLLTHDPPGFDPKGAISISTAAEWPWEAMWGPGELVARDRHVAMVGANHADHGTVGEYTFSGVTWGDYPVYQRQWGSYTFSLYRRKTGRWVVDFNAVSDDWSGTIGYTYESHDGLLPWTATWAQGDAASIFD